MKLLYVQLQMDMVDAWLPQYMGCPRFLLIVGFTIWMPDMALLAWDQHQNYGVASLVKIVHQFTQSLSEEIQVSQMHVETRYAKQFKAISHLAQLQLMPTLVLP
jgi:hypothetical protein